jgi:hypothetical protein
MSIYSFKRQESVLNYGSIKDFLESEYGMTNNVYDRDQWADFYGTDNSDQSNETPLTESFFRKCPKCKINDCGIGSTGRIRPYCKSCETEYAKERYETRRSFINSYKTEIGCQHCGYNAHPVALEFDHIDPSTKKFSIGSQLMSMSWKSIHEEIVKCQVLCANCHQIHTYESNHYAVRRS